MNKFSLNYLLKGPVSKYSHNLVNGFNIYILRGHTPVYNMAVAPHSSTLAWKTPWTEEPGGLLSMGLQRVRHDWATYTFFHLSIPAQQQPHCQFLPWTREQSRPYLKPSCTYDLTSLGNLCTTNTRLSSSICLTWNLNAKNSGYCL